MLKRHLLLSAMLLAGINSQTSAQTQKADLIIRGGSILTMEGATPQYVEAVAVSKGKIIFTGSNKDVSKLQTNKTIVKDLKNKVMLPGFMDPHSHFIDSLALSDRINVSAPPVGPASNPEQIVAELKKGAEQKKLKPGELLIGWGYDDNLMPNGQVLSRAVLDKAFPENPVVIVHVSMHGAVLNSKGFEKYGYKDGMPTPEGGVILREEDGKRLQGLVMEMAYLPISAKLPGPTLANEVEAAKAGQAMYAAAGITTAQEGLTHAEQLNSSRVSQVKMAYISM
ncbi:MAG: amidohydrolase family protein [Acinetobacter sp.]